MANSLLKDWDVMRSILEDYFEMRKSLGFKMTKERLELVKLIEFIEDKRDVYLKTTTAVEWAANSGSDPAWWGQRLTMARQFGRYWKTFEARTEIPPTGIFPTQAKRRAPLLHTDSELQRLLEAARRLRSRVGLRPHTYSTLLGLIMVAGLRRSEPCNLLHSDVDLTERLLLIRMSKSRTRIVPVHRSTNAALRRYAQHRDQLFPRPRCDRFFVSDRGTPITKASLTVTYDKLRNAAKIAPREDGRRPRLHDLRHRFAVAALTRWHEDGADVESRVHALTTYMGHAHPDHTYWYMSATPRLLRLAANRLERSHG